MKKRNLWLLTAWICVLCGAWFVTTALADNTIVYATETEDSTDDSNVITGLLTEDGNWEYMIGVAQSVVILRYHGTDTELVIPDTIPVSEDGEATEDYAVTEIYTEAFKGNTKLTSIQLPATVGCIGESAFADCTNLAEVLWTPDETSTVTIEKQAFENCTNLTSAILPTCDCLNVGYRAFAGCTSIDTLFLPATWRDILEEIPGIEDDGIYGDGYIHGGQFMDCSGLNMVGFEDGFSVIDAGMFAGCTLLDTVNLPDSIVEIDSMAFMKCSSLSTIDLPNSINIIEEKAFSSSGLTTISLPNSIRALRSDAFSKCTDLASVHIPSNIVSWGDNIFEGCNSDLIIYTSMTASNNTDVYAQMIADLTTTFGEEYISTNLYEEGVDETETYTFKPSASSDDTWEYQLTTNNYGETVAVITGYTNSSTSYPDKYLIRVPSVVVNGEESYMVTEIGDCAFMGYCGNTIYSDFILPDTITTIGDSAFNSIPGLRVWVPYTATKISTSAFSATYLYSPVIYTDCSDVIDFAIAEGIKYVVPISNLTFEENSLDYVLTEECEVDPVLPVLNILPRFTTENVTYSSSDENVVWISEDGESVYAYATGSAIITASCTNELTGEVIKANCTITVISDMNNANDSADDDSKDDTTNVQNPDDTTDNSEATTDLVIATKPTVNKVSSFKALSKKKGELSISWKKLSDIDGYQLQISTKKSFKGSKTISVKKSKTSYTAKKLTVKKKYYVRIRGYKKYTDENGETEKIYGAWATTNRVADGKSKVTVPKVSKVKCLKASAKKKALSISWKKQSNIDGYQIQISMKKNFKGSKTISVKKTKTSYAAKNLKAKTKYYVRIRAYKKYDDNGDSKKSYGTWVVKNKKTK